MTSAMTVEQHMERGDFEAALAVLATQIAGAAPDPGLVLMAFNLEVRLQRFDAAERTIRRLLQLAPQLAGPLGELAGNARAEARAAARLSDPALAGKRAGLGMPPPHAFGYVKAAVHHAQRDHATAAAALTEARQRTPRTPGTLTRRDGAARPFADLIDSDDLTGPILPCYEGDALLDLPYSQLRSITFLDPRTSFDAMWIPADIVPVTGEPLHVKVPAFYAGTFIASNPQVRSGQTTSWDHAHGYAEAVGQRDLKLIGLEDRASLVGILQVQKIELDAPAPTKPKSFWKKLFN
jgi:protein involved in temperature-dependent protein secretion